MPGAEVQTKIWHQHIASTCIHVYIYRHFLLPSAALRDIAIYRSHLRHKALHQCNAIVVHVSLHVERKKADPQ